MSGREFERQWSAGEQKEEAPPSSPLDLSQEAFLLGQVLDETLAMAERSESLDSPEMAPFVEVARTHRGQPLSLTPVTTDLVLSVLRQRFGGGAKGDGLWKSVADDIARALWDDPHLRGRLEMFWRRMLESIR